jgi:predicted Zn-dependent protease
MTREDIIKMAREAGFDPHDMSDDFTCNLEDIERFAALVAAAEREACAKMCDVLAVHPEYASDITKVAAQAIRARGRNHG